jgi:hypothetical protein
MPPGDVCSAASSNHQDVPLATDPTGSLLSSTRENDVVRVLSFVGDSLHDPLNT